MPVRIFLAALGSPGLRENLCDHLLHHNAPSQGDSGDSWWILSIWQWGCGITLRVFNAKGQEKTRNLSCLLHCLSENHTVGNSQPAPGRTLSNGESLTNHSSRLPPSRQGLSTKFFLGCHTKAALPPNKAALLEWKLGADISSTKERKMIWGRLGWERYFRHG